MELGNKVAIVTGAGRGIGREIALSLAKEGVKSFLVSRTEIQLKDTAECVKRSGGEAEILPIDISNNGSVRRIIDTCLDIFGRLDVLINNAAIMFKTNLPEVTEEEWDLVMNINLKAPFFLSKAALAVMKKQGEGYIINISSTAAFNVPPALTTYGISKTGIIGMSQALYESAKRHGVKVSVIYPGMTDTEMLREFNPPVDPEKWMKPADIAGCILFLLKQSNRVVVRDITPWATRHDQI